MKSHISSWQYICNYIFIIIIIIIIILLVQAWKKDNIKVELPPVKPLSFKLPVKAKKSKRGNTREQKCRDIIEKLTGAPYPTKRPAFLKNPKTGRNLELDGYCKELRSAFEYNGVQHYKFPNTFHKTKADFLQQVERDKFKIAQCEEYGIHLTVIPNSIADDELYDYIRYDLQAGKII